MENSYILRRINAAIMNTPVPNKARDEGSMLIYQESTKVGSQSIR